MPRIESPITANVIVNGGDCKALAHGFGNHGVKMLLGDPIKGDLLSGVVNELGQSESVGPKGVSWLDFL